MRNKKTIINVLLFRFHCKRQLKKMTNIKLREHYYSLLQVRRGKKSTQFPMWKVNIAFKLCVNELSKRN